MSDIFGGGVSGASRESQAAQAAQNRATEAFIREQTGQAREDVSGLFPTAQAVRGEGFQGALDLIGRGVPAQIDAFRGGNVAAQGITAASLPQIQNAILGLPVSGFSPVSVEADTSFMQGLNVPQLESPLSVIGGGVPPSNIVRGGLPIGSGGAVNFPRPIDLSPFGQQQMLSVPSMQSFSLPTALSSIGNQNKFLAMGAT